MRLLNTHSITFLIPSEGYRNTDMVWVEGFPVSSVINGSLQSYNSSSTLMLPDGVRYSDSRLFYTKSSLPTIDEYNESQAAYTMIDSKKYYAWKKSNNTGYGLKVDHYVYLLLSKPLDNGTSL